MGAYAVFFTEIVLVLHERDLFGRGSDEQSEDDVLAGWRRRVAVTVAIVLWLLTWLGGWWTGRTLSSGAFVWTMAGACVGWFLGLGLATLFLYLDERL